MYVKKDRNIFSCYYFASKKIAISFYVIERYRTNVKTAFTVCTKIFYILIPAETHVTKRNRAMKTQRQKQNGTERRKETLAKRKTNEINEKS